MANKEEPQHHHSVSTVLYVWPPTALDEEQPAVRARLALHAHAAHPALAMDALRQASLRAKLVAAKDVYATEEQEAALPWLIVYVGAGGVGGSIALDVSPAAGASESSCDAVRGVLDASGFAAVAGALRRALPASGRLDAFVVFYDAVEAEAEEGKWLRAESPEDVGAVIQDAVRSADVAYLRDASYADANPEVGAFLEALGGPAAAPRRLFAPPA
jgi:hypothetical protein